MQYFLNIYRKIYHTPIIHSGHAGVNNLEFAIARLKPDIYIASTPFAFSEISKRFPELDVRVLPNGVSLNDTRKIDLNLEHPIILYVGALVPYKRVDNLIKAFKMINKGSLLIIGSGIEKNNLLNLSEELNLKNIKFIDKVPLSELQSYFNSSDLFVLPSKNETFGIVYLNAMAANIPSIADRSEIQKWILSDAGIVCDCGNVSELAESIRNALNQNWNEKPLKRAKYFEWDKCSECYDLIIQEVVKKNGLYNWKEYWK